MATKRTVEFNFKTSGVNIADQMKKADKSAQSMQKRFDGIASKMKKVGGTLTKTLTLPIAAAGVASVKLASDMEETLNKVDVSFGKNSKEIRDWAKSSIKSMGLAQQSALDTAALFGDMGTGMGQTTDEAANMSMDLTQLSADLASFKNVSQDRAQTALAGVYTGETEALKGLGVVMTQANLEQFRMRKGMKKQIKDMTQAEKVALRYEFVMEATAKAHGDFERTGGGMANQTRMMTEQLKELGVQIGTIILPLALQLINKINQLLQWFMNLNPEVQKTILFVAGIIAVVGPLISLIGTMITVVSALKTALLFLAANPIVLFIMAIVAAVIILIKYFDEWKNGMKIIGRVLKNVFKGIYNAWAGIMNKMIGGMNWMIKAMLAPLNALIDGLNVVPGVNIPNVSVSIPKIPKLAEGGIVNRSTLANIGEGRSPEAVVPLNPQGIGKFVNGLNLSPSSKQMVNITIPAAQQDIRLDGQKVGHAITPQVTRNVKLGGGNI